MHRLVLLMAALSPIAPQTQLADSSGIEHYAPVTTTTMPPTVFRNNMPTVTAKPGNQKMKQGKSLLMLNYIFDSYASRNRHYHDRYRAPYFENDNTNSTEDKVIDASTGATVVFDCRVSSLRDKVVSWLRVTDDQNLEILTLNLETHTSDSRYKVDHAGENWRLALSNAKAQDSGTYCCHVSTHPPLLKRIKLTVHPPEIKMVKEAFLETSETLSLKCTILHLHSGDVVPRIRWYRGNSTVPIDEIREGVLIETNHFTLTTHLQVAGLKMNDAGNYTCALEAPRKMKAIARVHVLQGSSLAELQSGVKTTTSYLSLMLAAILVVFGRNGDIR